jgi:hypothetical protein
MKIGDDSFLFEQAIEVLSRNSGQEGGYKGGNLGFTPLTHDFSFYF